MQSAVQIVHSLVKDFVLKVTYSKRHINFLTDYDQILISCNLNQYNSVPIMVTLFILYIIFIAN